MRNKKEEQQEESKQEETIYDRNQDAEIVSNFHIHMECGSVHVC